MSEKPTQLILTGARGCIGRALQFWLTKNHPEIDIISISPFPFRIRDLTNALQSGFVKYFVNCVGLGRDSESVEAPFSYYETNTFGVAKQLELIREHAPSVRYLNLGTIYESTSSTPYSSSKRAAREIVTTYRSNYGMYAVTATLGFTEYYGRHESFLARRITKGLARIAKAIKDGQPFDPLFLRDLDQPFCWTWAEDVADGIWKTLNHAPPWDYVLSTGEEHTVREFVEKALICAKIWGRWHEGNSCLVDTEDELPLCVVAASGDSRTPPVDSHVDAARRDLGWAPQTTFLQLVSNLMDWEMKEAGLVDTVPPCPFRVGDIVRHVPMRIYHNDQLVEESLHSSNVATVTAVHHKGFDYQYPCHVYLNYSRDEYTESGTVFPAGYASWQCATPEELEAFRLARTSPPQITVTYTTIDKIT